MLKEFKTLDFRR